MPAPCAERWLCRAGGVDAGSSMWSSAAAVEFGLPYSFAHFFSPVKTRDAIETYMRSFRPGIRLERPEATVAVGVVCAETQEEAEFLASSAKLLQQRIRLGERKPVASPEEAVRELGLRGVVPLEEGEWPRYFVGTPAVVRKKLEQMAGALGIDELIVNTIVWDQQKRIKSYELLAKEFELRSTVKRIHRRARWLECRRCSAKMRCSRWRQWRSFRKPAWRDALCSAASAPSDVLGGDQCAAPSSGKRRMSSTPR